MAIVAGQAGEMVKSADMVSTMGFSRQYMLWLGGGMAISRGEYAWAGCYGARGQ